MINRREFGKASFLSASTVLAASTSTTLFAMSGTTPLRLAIVGVGGMGRMHLDWFRKRHDVSVCLLCDVDRRHLSNAAEMVPNAGSTDDFREVIDSDDVDAVLVATPDHWHGLVASMAAHAGKHVYCEKPLANSIGEGRAIVSAVHKNNIVFQTGSHERSSHGAKVARQLIRDGLLGNVHTVQIRLPNSDKHLQEVANFTAPPPDSEPPEELDYDFWLGHTPVRPYNERRCHFWWRFHSHYGGGEVTDRGAHVLDLANDILGLEGSEPVRIEAEGRPSKGGFFDTCIEFRFKNVYANGLTIVGDNTAPRGITFVGEKGKLSIAVHGGALTAEPASLLEGVEVNQVDAYSIHRENWLEGIHKGKPTVAPAEAGHRTACLCHLNNIAMRIGKPFDWDPGVEQSSCAEVNAMLTPEMRSPWFLPK